MMVRPTGVFACALALLVSVSLTGQSAPQKPKPPNTSPKAVAALASKYLEEYTARLASVVADETYLQETFASEGMRTGSRLIRGELYLTFLPADRLWLAVRDIIDVDGQPIPDHQSLPTLLLRSNLTSVVADVTKQNSRYNLGRVTRTFNEPTLGLLVVDRTHVGNFNFSRKQVDTAGDATLVTLSFVEHDRPTIVSSESGAPIFSKGELVIDAATGQVRATHLMLKDGRNSADLMTTYMLEPRLNLWVPSVFTERYEGELEGLKEIDTGRSQYTNYREWGAFGRIRRGGH